MTVNKIVNEIENGDSLKSVDGNDICNSLFQQITTAQFTIADNNEHAFSRINSAILIIGIPCFPKIYLFESCKSFAYKLLQFVEHKGMF